jgi:hypothetical protein
MRRCLFLNHHSALLCVFTSTTKLGQPHYLLTSITLCVSSLSHYGVTKIAAETVQLIVQTETI